MKRLYFTILFLVSSSGLMAQTDGAGPGRSITFDAIDDYIDLGNVYDDLNFPVTISAWVYVEPSTQYILPILATQDNAPIYNGLWFCLSGTNLFVEYGDGRGQQSSAYRRGKSAPIAAFENRWIFVSAVVKSGSDIQLYVNGSNVGGESTGSSSLPMASNFPNDVAKIGYLYTNDVIHRFKGTIDELRFYNRALNEQEIRATMCKRLKGDESGLIGYWNFDEISGDVLKDLSPKGFDGVLKGSPKRGFSGAPVGDESVFLYTPDWSGKTLSSNTVTVSNVSASANGVHIYKVNQIPSQTGGLNVSALQIPYYGVFVADDGENNSFDLSFTQSSCEYFQREDNSDADWYPAEEFSDIPGRLEIVSSGGEPPDFSLGEDELLCDLGTRVLSPGLESDNFTFTWQDGSTGPSFQVNDFGTYILKLQNACGSSTDTITFTRKVFTNLETYNFISPNNQDDRNQFFMIDERLVGANLSVFNRWGKPVFEVSGYKNDWDGDNLPSGVYFYTITDECIEPLKGTLTIMR